MQKSILITLCLFLLLAAGQTGASTQEDAGQRLSRHSEIILNLMENIFVQIPRDLDEIDPGLNRIAVYRIDTGDASLTPPLKAHFESRLVQVLGVMGEPKIVALPEMSTLRISSTDSSFSVVNALPSPDELWKVGRRLRVEAFLEGNLTYVDNKALFLDLRLNRTGTNEVLWAKSYAAYVRGVKIKRLNPLRMSVNAGLEVFNIDVNATTPDTLHPDFNNRLVQYAIYFGLYQFMTANSRLRYELRAGLSFLSEGVRFKNSTFGKSSFYALDSGGALTKPASFNFRAMLYATLLPNKNNSSGDWLSVYAALTRYFTNRAPDLTGIGIGFRSDLSSRFSLSSGFSMIRGPEFNSEQLSSGRSVRTRINSLHYEIMMLQFSF